ncbi:death-associated protein-like 1 isoform X4 [Ahaetulla prasina]|uniref:death-associated protein-like 1 isoform X4 n=1 Tax=Ahaetulla prasina TaxID=499056 RepID=UPI0026474832|nr:death-associated protein-like 1 isoform X4 [Ahaetulla prasina]
MANSELSPPPSPAKGERLPAGKEAGCLRKVKAGSMEVSKKLENAPVERSSKFAGKEKTSSAPVKKVQSLKHTFPATAAQGAYEKPRPTLEKIVLPKRMCIIQQPRKC